MSLVRNYLESTMLQFQQQSTLTNSTSKRNLHLVKVRENSTFGSAQAHRIVCHVSVRDEIVRRLQYRYCVVVVPVFDFATFYHDNLGVPVHDTFHHERVLSLRSPFVEHFSMTILLS